MRWGSEGGGERGEKERARGMGEGEVSDVFDDTFPFGKANAPFFFLLKSSTQLFRHPLRN